MKKLTTFILLLCAATAFSAPAQKDGFSGYFDLGILGISSTDATMTSDNNEDIDTLSDNPDSFSQGHIIALFNLQYKKGDKIFHAGMPLEQAEPQLMAGITYENGRSTTDLSVIFDIFGEEWKDPYESSRDTTKRESVGLRLKMENISGTQFGFEAKVMSHNIKDDEIGDRFSDMRRDGATYSIKGEYNQPLGNRNKITPFIEYKREQRLGDAFSSNAIGLGAKYMQATSRGFIMPVINVYAEGFDDEDAVFDKTRRDKGAAAFLMYRHNFTPKTHGTILGGASVRRSNIDFYDAETFFTGATIGFDF
ncbi:MAG: DUF2860 family protein [Deferribacterales bacterium]